MNPPRLEAAGRRWSVTGVGALALALLLPGPLSGQVIPDTTVVEPEDTLGLDPDTLGAVPDTLAADTIPALQLPGLARPTPPGWVTGVWEWDREAILGSRALTLAGLVSEIPGITWLRGGDYGSPVSLSAFGSGGGRIRVFRDGLEVLPLEGSVVDLTRVGMAGLQTVRVIRTTSEVRIELTSLLAEGGRPYSLVEAGTGDLNTNVFRGTFSHPRALGGVIAVGLDRVDTQGTQGAEPGSGSGGWVRYGRPLWGPGAIVVDFSRSGADRGELFAPSRTTRTDWSVRTRWSLFPGVVGDLYHASSSLSVEEGDTLPFGSGARSQTGALLSVDSRLLKLRGQVQRMAGEGIPELRASMEAHAALGPVGGVGGEVTWEDWGERSISRSVLRAWTAPVLGVSLFAERSSGEWGLPFLPDRIDRPSGVEGEEPPPPDTVPSPVPGPRFSPAGGHRYGAQLQWGRLSLSGARLQVEADSLFPLGLPSDAEGVTLPGGTRKGFEVAGRIPLYPEGLALVGSYQWWDQAEDVFGPDSIPLTGEDVPWRYLPRRGYQGTLAFHDTFFPTGNLELWFDLGVAGRDPMVVPFPDPASVGEGTDPVLATVPFDQSWFVRLQIRVVSVRVFFQWENFTLRQRNQDFPGRILPATRSMYGVRWTMWN